MAGPMVLNDHACVLLHVLVCDEIAGRRSPRLIESGLVIALSGDGGER